MAGTQFSFRVFGPDSGEAGSREEHEQLIADEEQLEDISFPPRWTTDQAHAPNPHAHLPVYTTIHHIRRDVTAAIDDPYSIEMLRSPRMNLSVVRPMVDKLYEKNDVSIVYCLLVNRVQFLREQTYFAHHQSVNITRALLCEIVANRILRRYDEDNPEPRGVLVLANVLVAGFNPFQGAPEDVIRDNSYALPWLSQKRGGFEADLTALELGIISESKLLLGSSACQKVVDAIYLGRVVYTPSSFMDILPDHYKRKPIALYDPKDAPLLNQYRLIVPRTRNLLEICQFLVLLVLYFLVLESRNPSSFTIYELAFCVYTWGWSLDQVASMLEHGWQVYTQNLWSFLDVAFILIYGTYFVFRMLGLAAGDVWYNQQAIDILSIGAPVLVPRLGFNFMSENMLFVSLRAMVASFTLLSFLAVWCFGGFLLAMKWLSNGTHTTITISKWMLWVWFGLDGTGIQRSVEFHWLLGPILMVTFAFLGNTLFLTILVAILSKTFSDIVTNANAEIQFRRAVLTFEGVKSDAIFSYPPPFNILALCILLPLKFVVSARWFHKVNVAAVRMINAPLLIIINIYERRALWRVANRKAFGSLKPRGTIGFGGISRFSVHGDIQAVFDSEPPPSLMDLEVGGIDNTLDGAFPVPQTLGDTLKTRKERKDSIEPFAGLAEHFPDILQRFSRNGDTQTRLEILEASTKRIEDMLRKLCESMDNSGSEENG